MTTTKRRRSMRQQRDAATEAAAFLAVHLVTAETARGEAGIESLAYVVWSHSREDSLPSLPSDEVMRAALDKAIDRHDEMRSMHRHPVREQVDAAIERSGATWAERRAAVRARVQQRMEELRAQRAQFAVEES